MSHVCHILLSSNFLILIFNILKIVSCNLSYGSFLTVSSDIYFLFFFFSDEEDIEEKENPLVLGEGGESGGLVPGKSLVFAAMELLMFILVRHMPHLSSKVSDSPSHIAAKSHLSEESARLVAATVTILSDLPSLCSPAGTLL